MCNTSSFNTTANFDSTTLPLQKWFVLYQHSSNIKKGYCPAWQVQKAFPCFDFVRLTANLQNLFAINDAYADTHKKRNTLLLRITVNKRGNTNPNLPFYFRISIHDVNAFALWHMAEKQREQ